MTGALRSQLVQFPCSDVHKFRGIKGAASIFRDYGSVSADTVECIIFNILRLPDIIADSVSVNGCHVTATSRS